MRLDFRHRLISLATEYRNTGYDENVLSFESVARHITNSHFQQLASRNNKHCNSYQVPNDANS